MANILRRRLLMGAGAITAATVAPAGAAADDIPTRAPRSTPIGLMPSATRDAIRGVTGSASLQHGRVTLEIPEVVDNGNVVSLAVRVDSPMNDRDFVRAIHVFSEKNPQPYVITLRLGPQAGVAAVATRIRLAATQTVVAIAELSDGSFWYATADSVVAMSACLEEL